MTDSFVTLGRLLLNLVTWPDLGWWLLRLTAIAALGHLILALLPRASAATRHAVALVTLMTVAAAPMASVLLPSWPLAVWPAALVTTSPSATPNLSAGRQDVAMTAVLGPRTLGPPAPSRALTIPVASLPASRPRSAFPPKTPAALVLGAWLVSMVLLSRVALSVIAARWMCGRAEVVEDPALRRELDLACRQLEVWHPVELRSSPRVMVPVVAGLFRPVLLIPPHAMAWSREKRWAVFLHEVAHLRRHDAAWLLLARIATALLWFHPLVWTLARVARRDCERACDDVVLESGVRASDYAGHLLAIARAAAGSERIAGATLAFARRSSLEGRLMSLLGPEVPRGPASRQTVAAVGVALMLVVLALVSVRVVAATDAKAGSETRKTSDSPAVSRQDKTTWDVDSGTNRAVEAPIAIAAGHEKGGDRGGASSSDSPSGEEWFDRAREHYQAERYSEAATAYERAARAEYRPATAWYNAACSYALEGRRQPALTALEHSLDQGFDQIDLLQSDDDLNSIRGEERFRSLLNRAMHSDAGEDKRRRAIARYESLRESNSTRADEWKSVGITLLHSGEPEKAAAAFERQHAIDESSSAIYNQACARALAGDRERALASLERSIVSGYGDGESIQKDADLFSLHREPRFDQLVDLADDLQLYHDGRGDDDDVSAWREVLPRFGAVTRQYPNLGRAWFNLGYARLRARDARGSLEAFQRSLDLGYRKPTTLYNLACAAAQVPDREAALQWLERAEAAGMRLEDVALHDRDLDPLRSDARFQKMEDRWEQNLWKAQDKNKYKVGKKT